MKTLKYIFVIVTLMISFCSCIKQRFYPDIDDPGLSRFTSKHFNAGTCYINDTAYINYWPSVLFNNRPIPKITKVITAGSTMDSIDFRWEIALKKGNKFTDGNYRYISIRMPVSKGFTVQDFVNWSGRQFASDANTLTLDGSFILNHSFKGSANIYFVKIFKEELSGNIYASGLFNGRIGDSIFVKNGRFDYLVKTENF